MILSQHSDGNEEEKVRKELMVKYVFEDERVDKAIELLDRKDVTIVRV